MKSIEFEISDIINHIKTPPVVEDDMDIPHGKSRGGNANVQ